MADLLLKGGTLIDEEGNVHKSMDILLSRGTIHSIGESRDQHPADLDVMVCSSYFITPGLPNLHTHSPMNIFKGIAEDVDEHGWFNEEIWPYESKMESGDVYAGAKLAIAEMLNRGVTAFADHYFEAEMICRAAMETGIRLDMAPTLFGMAGGFDEQLNKSADLINAYRDKSDRIAFRFGPHAPYTCNPDELKKTALKSEEMNLGIHIHVADAEAQIAASMEKYGKTPFQILKDTGVLSRPLIVGHGLWILDEEIELIEDETWFAVCPKTYMKLSAGTGRVWKNRERLPLCIGTDGAASSNSLDPLEQLKLFLLLGKLNLGDARAFTLEEGWKMLMKGHEAMPFKSGRLKEGYAADLLFWNLNHINTLPVYNPLASIIYSANAENIVHSMIGGDFVKKDGKVELDLIAIGREADERARSILKRGKGNTKLIF